VGAGAHRNRRAERVVTHLEHVHADVDQRTAPLQFFAADNAPVRATAPAQCLYARIEDAAELAAVGGALEELRARIESILEADDEFAAEPFGGRDHLFAFFRAAGERFFAQDGATSFHRADRAFRVQLVRR